VLVESTRNTPLTPEPQPSLSPESQPISKHVVLQVYEGNVRKDVELIKEKFQGVFKTEKDLEFLSSNSHVPKACAKPCAKAYTSIIDSLKKADKQGATNVKSINEDYDVFSVDITICQQCLDVHGNGRDASAVKSMKFMNQQLKNDILDWLIALQYMG